LKELVALFVQTVCCTTRE